MSSMMIATRREFLTQGLGLVGVGAALPNFLVRTALAGPKASSGEKILVVVQFSGGHDGMSAVVPYGLEEYGQYRKATRIAEKDVLKIGHDVVGLHPNLSGFADLLEQGSFAIVQGVGYPNPNQSHFRSMDIWHTGDNTVRTNTSATDSHLGWIGKYFDDNRQDSNDPKLAMALGGGKSPRAIRGREHFGLSFSKANTFGFSGMRGDGSSSYEKLNRMTKTEKSNNGNMEFVTQTAVNANACSEEIRRLSTQHKLSVSFPTSSLAQSLQTVASLIGGGLSTRVYYVFQGGFDTHSGQRARHDKLTTDMSAAIVAFQQELTAQGNADRVLSFCFSEFGRRAKENKSQGTDHGMAGPMFLIGPALKAGVYGKHPSLAEDDLLRGNPQFQIDFRTVYSAAIENWLGGSSEKALGGKFTPLDYLG